MSSNIILFDDTKREVQAEQARKRRLATLAVEEVLADFISVFENADREGAEKDEPEGARYIQVSDTFATKLSDKGMRALKRFTQILASGEMGVPFRPTKGRIIVSKPVEPMSERFIRGLEIPDMARGKSRELGLICTVVKVADDVCDLKPGDVVLVNELCGTPLYFGNYTLDSPLWVIGKGDPMAVVHDIGEVRDWSGEGGALPMTDEELEELQKGGA